MDLIATPDNPAPDGVKAGYLTTGDGVRLRYAVCMEGNSPKGTVCIFQGRGEFIEKYFETAADLRRRGYAVALLDWRGQGGSERLLRNGLKGHVRSFRQYEADLAAFMTGVALPDCPPPYCAIAHSTGGTVLLQALATRTWFTRVVTTAPLLALHAGPVAARLMGFATRLAVLVGLSRVSVPGRGGPSISAEYALKNKLTADSERYLRNCRVLEAAPELAVGRPTFGWLRAARVAMRDLKRAPISRRPRVPVLIVAAGEDEVVSTEACRQYGARMPGVAVVAIERSKHEILMERDVIREQFWAAFDSFMGEELPVPQPSRSSALASS